MKNVFPFKFLIFGTLLTALLVYERIIWFRKCQDLSDPVEFQLNERMKGPISQNDPRLVQYVRKHHLTPAPSRSTNYNVITAPNEDPSAGQSKIVLNLLKNKTGGFFVECGAYDGENLSNTLYMERELGWKGLLIEANPNLVKHLKQKNRKAWIADVCISRYSYPEKVMFRGNNVFGKIIDNKYSHETNVFEVQCIPFFTLMLAMNRTYVDYFSLDVEGNEISVLEAIPFKKITINVMSVEYPPHNKHGVENVLRKHGYNITHSLESHSARDLIAIKKV